MVTSPQKFADCHPTSGQMLELEDWSQHLTHCPRELENSHANFLTQTNKQLQTPISNACFICFKRKIHPELVFVDLFPGLIPVAHCCYIYQLKFG